MASVKVTEAINLIKSNQKTADLYVPSLKKTIKFKHLTAGQQEKFVQSLVDNPALQTKFTLTLIDIIKENCEDKKAVIDFTILDRHAIALGLRVASVGKNLKTEVNNEPGIVYNIDLENNLNTLQSVTHDPFDPIEIDEFKIDLQYPTISLEASNERYFRRDETTIENSVDSIRSVISNAFIGDAIMFIKTLTINKTEGDPFVLDFSNVTIQDKLDLVRRLPNAIFEKMLDPMTSVKRQIETMLKGTGVSEADPKIKRTILIAFDASLFIAAS